MIGLILGWSLASPVPSIVPSRPAWRRPPRYVPILRPLPGRHHSRRTHLGHTSGAFPAACATLRPYATSTCRHGAHADREPADGHHLRRDVRGAAGRHRLAAGLTQEALAERAGLSARGVQDLERGVRAAPRAETVRLLADALGLDAAARAALVAGRAPGAGALRRRRAAVPLRPARPAGPADAAGRARARGGRGLRACCAAPETSAC